jgi:glycyl-tRNA synthetase beta chain
MGTYYAKHDGVSEEVAAAITEHYMPRFSGDAVPTTLTGTVVALADKLETVAGLFSVGQIPTGDKDPYALRRHAVGILRILIEKSVPVPITALIGSAMAIPSLRSLVLGTNVPWLIQEFFYDRLSVMMRERDFSAQEVDSVISTKPDQIMDVPKRLAAVRAFAQLPEAPALAAANKRVGNILKKAEGAVEAKVNPTLLQVDEEKALHSAINSIAARANIAWVNGDYTANLQALAALKDPVDAFFDKVMVNAEDPALKANRLGLLATLHQAMNRVADLSKLAS